MRSTLMDQPAADQADMGHLSPGKAWNCQLTIPGARLVRE